MSESRVAGIGSELMTKTLFLYVTTLAGAALGYLNLLLAVRYVGHLEYGIVAFALSFESIFVFVTDFGFSRSHTKKVSEGSDFEKCLLTYIYIRLMLTIAYSIVIVASLLIWENVLGQHFDHPDTHGVLLLLLVYNCLVSFRWVFVHSFYAKREVVKGQSVIVFEALVRACALAPVVVFEMGAVGLAGAFAISGAASLAISVWLTREHLLRSFKGSLDRILMSEYISFALPISLSLMLGTVALYFDKIMIQSSLSATETGTFFASQRFLSIYVSLGAVVTVIAFPAISSLTVLKRDPDRIARLTSEAMRYLSLLVFPVTLYLVFFSGNVLSELLSPDLEYASVAFAILAVNYGLFIMTTPSASQALGMGYASEYARYNVVYSVIVVALDIVLIPSQLFSVRLAGLGLEGAALALLIAQLVNSAMFYRNSKRTVGIKPPSGLVRIGLSSIFAALVAYMLCSLSGLVGLAQLVASALVFVAAYCASVLALRALTLSEIVMLVKKMSLRNLKGPPGT